MTKKEKRALRLQICRMLDTECAKCKKVDQALDGKKNSERDSAKNQFQNYCITECSTGERLRSIASELTGEKIKPPKKKSFLAATRQREELTPQSYVADKEKGMKDWQIAMQYDISTSRFGKIKKCWREQGLLEVGV
ncbi:uncharacterized protein DUF2602 [Aneurinibacillus soli]|uniref:Uncharacterized protein n=1 Tax=Aneurinibacillus soli TaxID=1500254 RepID=A0A0U5BBV9_9BACL|nr:zinc-finger domain-containing protein [Aneurinibacillus soli]PYE64256.1 uncharacterized protein DUF2602 [Aneurinibacillus soli]BAU28205.1 hypothetical protein CB4_02379 [Aneurinibacillus soli]